MTKLKKKARKSLRTLLIMWLIMFSVVPLAFITGYSLVKYEQAINQELNQRLLANRREIQIILQEYQTELVERNRRHASDRQMGFYLASNQMQKARALATNWMKGHFAHQLSVFNQDGRLEVALYRGEGGEIERDRRLEGKDVYLSERFLQKTEKQDEWALTDFSGDGSLDLIAFAKIRAANGSVVGYVEEIVKIDPTFLAGLRNRLGLEVFFFSADGEKVVGSHEDLNHYKAGFFADIYNSKKSGLFELNIRGVPYGFTIHPISWGDDNFYVGLGASKRAIRAVLKNVNMAFFGVVGTIILLLIFLSIFISKILLKPLNELVESLQTMDPDGAPVEIKSSSDTELGLLTESFNDLSQRVYTAQKALKDNIKKLEDANSEIRETQAKLVHAAKMASLGQLVAGIAHELNNPISFIYSNMSHLRDYSDKLIQLAKAAEKKIDLSKEKEDFEFDYITEDLPKLIKSCEDGARRTRDIVVGLRNFSRLEEAKVKEVDLHEGIDSTLALLDGEFKGRIEIQKDYGHLPKVLCYPSQLNQVFMNILSNAGQAIEGEGRIKITTKMSGKNQVTIIIQDSGKGMSQEVQEKIFDPFFTTKDISAGTGLGMSISYGIVQKHGGEISVSSSQGKGTTFTITLPVRG